MKVQLILLACPADSTGLFSFTQKLNVLPKRSFFIAATGHLVNKPRANAKRFVLF